MHPVTVDNAVAKVGTSIGIACFPEHGRAPDELLQRADQATYLAKQSGKNSCRLVAPVIAVA